MRSKKKGAIELSMTTIIVIILGVSLLTLGIFWIRGTMKQVTELSDKAFLDAEREINANMGTNEKFYIGGISFDLKPNSKKSVYAGIQNLLGKDETFTIKVEAADGVSDPKWIIVPISIDVPASEKGASPFTISVPATAASGETHMYKIYALDSTNKLYASSIITVNVVG